MIFPILYNFTKNVIYYINHNHLFSFWYCCLLFHHEYYYIFRFVILSDDEFKISVFTMHGFYLNISIFLTSVPIASLNISLPDTWYLCTISHITIVLTIVSHSFPHKHPHPSPLHYPIINCNRSTNNNSISLSLLHLQSLLYWSSSYRYIRVTQTTVLVRTTDCRKVCPSVLSYKQNHTHSGVIQ